MRPVLLHLFGLPLHGYGSMLLLSFAVGWRLALLLAERDGLDAGRLSRSIPWTVAGALAGARLLYVATNPQRFAHLLDVFQVWRGGLVAYGGFLGGLAAAALFCRRHRLPLLPWADCAAPALGSGVFFTRIGCLLAGCDFGQAWDGPWAIRFPPLSPAFRHQVANGLLDPRAAESLPVHPTQLYESLAGLILFGLAIFVRRRRSFRGQAFLAFAMGYGALRSLIEVFRADADRGGLGALSTSQLVGLGTCALATAVLVRMGRGHLSHGSPVSGAALPPAFAAAPPSRRSSTARTSRRPCPSPSGSGISGASTPGRRR